MKRKELFLELAFVLALSLQACGAATPAPTNEHLQERLSTSVAGTLAAQTKAPTQTSPLAPTPTATAQPTRVPGPLRVVYSRAGSIWIWTEGGQPRQLTNNIVDAKPRLSDDGQLVVFERNNELYAVNSDGSNLHVLVSDAFLKPYIPQGYKFIWAEFYDWMPDSHLVYFSTKTGISGPETDKFQFDLFRADVDSGEVKQIVAPGSGGVPYFSTEGKTIAMAQGKAIYLVNADGSDVRKALTFEMIYTWSEWTFIPVVVPLPDGSGFRIVIPTHGPGDGPGNPPEFWNIPIQGQPTLLYTLPVSNTILSNNVRFRNLSPNGESFVYVNYNADESSQICFHQNGIAPDNCWYQSGMNGGFVNWAPDSVHMVTSDQDEERNANYYLTDSLGKSSPIVATGRMYWIDMNRYIFNSGLDLYLTSINGEQTKIDSGISPTAGKVDIWAWQFDYSY